MAAKPTITEEMFEAVWNWTHIDGDVGSRSEIEQCRSHLADLTFNPRHRTPRYESLYRGGHALSREQWEALSSGQTLCIPNMLSFTGNAEIADEFDQVGRNFAPDEGSCLGDDYKNVVVTICIANDNPDIIHLDVCSFMKDAIKKGFTDVFAQWEEQEVLIRSGVIVSMRNVVRSFKIA